MNKNFKKWSLVLFVCLEMLGCQSNTKDNEKAELYLRIGISHYQAGNYPQALAELLKANELDPRNPVVKNNLGLVYFMREKYDLAEQQLVKCLELDPAYTDARNNYVRILIENKKLDEAEKNIQKVLSDLTYGGIERAYVNQGMILFQRKKFLQAEVSFQKAVDYQRDSCSAMSWLGRSIFEQSQYEKAAAVLDRAAQFCQKLMIDEPHYYSALAYFRAGDKEKSKTRFEEILRIYPNGKYQEKSRQMIQLLSHENK